MSPAAPTHASSHTSITDRPSRIMRRQAAREARRVAADTTQVWTQKKQSQKLDAAPRSAETTISAGIEQSMDSLFGDLPPEKHAEERDAKRIKREAGALCLLRRSPEIGSQ